MTLQIAEVTASLKVKGVGIVTGLLNMETNSSLSSHTWFSTLMISPRFTESENGLGWNGPLEVTYSLVQFNQTFLGLSHYLHTPASSRICAIAHVSSNKQDVLMVNHSICFMVKMEINTIILFLNI